MLSRFVTQCFSTGFASYPVSKGFTIPHVQMGINAELIASHTSRLSPEDKTAACRRRPVVVSTTHQIKRVPRKTWTVDALVFPLVVHYVLQMLVSMGIRVWRPGQSLGLFAMFLELFQICISHRFSRFWFDDWLLMRMFWFYSQKGVWSSVCRAVYKTTLCRKFKWKRGKNK